MGFNKEILKKVLWVTVWVGVASVSIVLLVAATRKHASDICEQVVVNIKGGEQGKYIQEKEILDRVSGGHPELLTGTRISNLSISQLETLLEQHLWIRNSEMYFDNQNILHIDIEERVPVARVFSLGGESFYVDEKGMMLPVNGNQIANVPVFTGFPQVTYPMMGKDSVLLLGVRDLGAYIITNEFWNAQIDQIHIDNYQMELIPKLGKHQILFGDGNMIEVKFKRLMLFYQQIMKKAGWNYYSTLDLRFDKQLVAVRRDSLSLYQSFIIPFDTLVISKEIDSVRIARDTSLSILQTASPKNNNVVRKDSASTARKIDKPADKSENNLSTKNNMKQNDEERNVLQEVLADESPKNKSTSNKKTKP
jgi:cell division protein FtsQ